MDVTHEPDELSDLLSLLHHDKTARLWFELRLLEREVATRRLVSAEHTVRLYEQINDLTREILRLLPEHEHAADPHRMIRQGLERERRNLERELAEEVRARWRDVQELKREERTVRRELFAALQQYERSRSEYAP